MESFGRSYLVAGLTEDQIREILAIGRFRRLTAQEFLMRRGEPSADLYVVLDGRLSVISGEGEKLGEVGKGMVVGEVALCDAGKRTADVIALGLVDVVQLPAASLRAHLASKREVGFMVLANLSKVLATRLRQTNEKVDALLEKPRDTWDRAL